MSNTQTQIDAVHQHLRKGNITPAKALVAYGITRLAVAINHLRNRGLDIDMVLRHDSNGKQYGEYHLRRGISVGDTVQVRKGCGYGLPGWVRTLRNAKVVRASKCDTAFEVRFVRGRNERLEWLNAKELVNAN